MNPAGSATKGERNIYLLSKRVPLLVVACQTHVDIADIFAGKKIAKPFSQCCLLHAVVSFCVKLRRFPCFESCSARFRLRNLGKNTFNTCRESIFAKLVDTVFQYLRRPFKSIQISFLCRLLPVVACFNVDTKTVEQCNGKTGPRTLNLIWSGVAQLYRKTTVFDKALMFVRVIVRGFLRAFWWRHKCVRDD